MDAIYLETKDNTELAGGKKMAQTEANPVG